MQQILDGLKFYRMIYDHCEVILLKFLKLQILFLEYREHTVCNAHKHVVGVAVYNAFSHRQESEDEGRDRRELAVNLFFTILRLRGNCYVGKY